MATRAPAAVATGEPMLTYLDDATGERTELTGPQLGQWAARSAGLLRDGCGLRPGDRVAVLLPPHWAVFVTPERLDDWLEDVPEGTHRYLVGTGPGPLAEVPPGWLDWSAEVLRHPTEPPDYTAVDPAGPATADGTSFGAWRRLAAEIATWQNLRPGDRLVVDPTAEEQPLKWLLAPLSAGATVLIHANPRPTP
ncbi:AMP-dependent synthetase [Micromonospora marina]|uniref:AMP-dependent synthetase n=1 Tax=Micromonospora marina TaxID=307120 RepID=UPI003454727A